MHRQGIGDGTMKPMIFALLIAVLAAAQAAGQATPIPKFTGPLPVTADSYPFLAAEHSLVPFDLAKHGYVEQEFIVTGTANVYSWSGDGSLAVKTPNAPYGARI